jgi:hypothetical protein
LTAGSQRSCSRHVEEDNPSRTDAELMGLLDDPSGWMVWAGDASAAPRGSLREALSQAFDLSEDGFAITHIAKVPDDVIVISLTQIRRLWQALGLLDS